MRLLGVLLSAGCLAAFLAITGVDASAGSSSEVSSRCDACRAAVTHRLLRSRRLADCRDGVATGNEARVRRAVARVARTLERCERPRVCGGSDAPRAALASLRQAVSEAGASICASTRSEGEPVDPGAAQGPVGSSPPAVDPTTAPSLDDVAESCRISPDDPPPLLALPEVAELPEWCSEAAAYVSMVAACGTPRVVVVHAGADPVGATGTADYPYPSITDALASCGAEACHLLVAPGTYAEGDVSLRGCTFIEGGVTLSDGTLVSGGTRPRIEGSLGAFALAGPVMLARIEIGHPYGTLFSNGDVLVSEAVLRGSYEGASSAFDAVGPRVCRSHVTGGYVGLNVAWQSRRLWIAGSAIAGCTVGVDFAWGSRDMRVVDSVVFGGYVAIDINWGSADALIQGCRISSPATAVNLMIAADQRGVFPETFDVTITQNRINSGDLPQPDPALNVVVERNVRE